MTQNPPSVADAFEHYKTGKHDRAEEDCRRILKKDPKNIRALELLGVLYMQKSDMLEEADELFSQALALEPNALVYSNRGNVLLALGKTEEAINDYVESLKLMPDNAATYVNFASALRSAGRFKESQRASERAVELDPKQPSAYLNLGNALKDQEMFDEARKHLLKSLELNPRQIAPYMTLSMIAQAEKKFDEAVAFAEKGNAVVPNHPQGLLQLGLVYMAAGNEEKSKEVFAKSISIDPDNERTHHALGLSLFGAGKYDEVRDVLKEALKINPNYTQALISLAETQRKLGEPKEAMSCLLDALTQDPENPAIYMNIGALLMDLGNITESIYYFNRARDLGMTSDILEWNMSRAYLASGDIVRGFQKYYHGFGAKQRTPNRTFEKPLWTGEDLSDKTVMVWREQGVGDELMFATCYRDLIAKAKKVIIECAPRYVTLFTRSFPEASVRDDTVRSRSDFDYHIPAGDLPKHFRKTVESFPDGKFLVPDPDLCAKWKARLNAIDGKPKVGICLASLKMTKEKEAAFIKIDRWKALLKDDELTFINLTPGDHERELKNVKRYFGRDVLTLEDFDRENDFENMAAMMAALDSVVSATTMTFHMGGALGVPTYVCFPVRYWMMLGTTRLPWFNSVSVEEKRFDNDGKFLMKNIANSIVARQVYEKRTAAALQGTAKKD